MDSTQAAWGAALSGFVVVGAAAGLIVAGNSDSDTGTDSGPIPTVEQPREVPHDTGEMNLDGNGDGARVPEQKPQPSGKSDPGNNESGSLLPSIIPDSLRPDGQN